MSNQPIATLSVSAISKAIDASEYSIRNHIKKLNIQPVGYADGQKRRPLYSTKIIKKMEGCPLRKQPKKNNDDTPSLPKRKSIVKSIRLRASEATRIDKICKNKNISFTELITLGMSKGEAKCKTVRHIQAADPALIRQLTLIGNNLNQLARSMNQANKKGQLPTGLPTAIFATLCDIDERLGELKP